jgi:pimeloyl-ACP methyl ester carboxylesterase
MTPQAIAARLHDKEARFRFLFQRMYNPKLLRRLARISAPTLVLWGQEERLLPIGYGQAYARAISGARFVTLPGGHALPSEQPALFCATVDAFLSEGR